MEIQIKKIPKTEKEGLLISCYEVTDQVTEIVDFVKSRHGRLEGHLEGREFEIPLVDIFYLEAVDNRIYIYTEDRVYESRQKLYELEQSLDGKNFLRISKSVIINLMKVKSIKPALNGRFLASLKNGEEIMISRKYVPDLKKRLKGDGKNER